LFSKAGFFDKAADLGWKPPLESDSIRPFPDMWRHFGPKNLSSFAELLTGRYECAIHVDMLELF
jgi:hypothetical protein